MVELIQVLKTKLGPYLVRLKADDPVKFVQEFWSRAGSFVPNDSQAVEQWTDRGKWLRSSVSGSEVCIHTHASTPEQDKSPMLPEAVNAIESIIDRSL